MFALLLIWFLVIAYCTFVFFLHFDIKVQLSYYYEQLNWDGSDMHELITVLFAEEHWAEQVAELPVAAIHCLPHVSYAADAFSLQQVL